MDLYFIYKEFGRRLRHARKAAELTQDAVSERVGLSRTSITNIEKGRQRIPLHALFLLASAVGVSPAALLPERKETYTSGVIDHKLLSKTQLDNDVQEWVTKLVTSGVSQEEKDEPRRKQSQKNIRRAKN